MDCSTPGFPVHHQLLQLAQTLTRLHYSRSIYYLPNVLNTYFVDYLLSQLEYNLSTGRSYFCFTPPCVWQLCTVPRVCAQSLSWVWLYVTPWTVACQAPRSMGFSQQEYWNGWLFPPPGDLPDPGLNLLPAMAGRFFTTSATWEAPPRVYRIIVVQWRNGELWC